jgi:nitrogen-specific signal transduction histidine kinase
METQGRKAEGKGLGFKEAFEIKKFIKDTSGTINTEIDHNETQCKITLPTKKKVKEEEGEKKRDAKAASKESKNKLEHQLN